MAASNRKTTRPRNKEPKTPKTDHGKRITLSVDIIDALNNCVPALAAGIELISRDHFGTGELLRPHMKTLQDAHVAINESVEAEGGVQ